MNRPKIKGRLEDNMRFAWRFLQQYITKRPLC